MVTNGLFSLTPSLGGSGFSFLLSKVNPWSPTAVEGNGVCSGESAAAYSLRKRNMVVPLVDLSADGSLGSFFFTVEALQLFNPVWTSMTPKMKEDLVIRTLKRAKIDDMKSNPFRGNRKVKDTIR